MAKYYFKVVTSNGRVVKGDNVEILPDEIEEIHNQISTILSGTNGYLSVDKDGMTTWIPLSSIEMVQLVPG